MYSVKYYIFKEVRVPYIQNEMSDENRFLKTNRVGTAKLELQFLLYIFSR